MQKAAIKKRGCMKPCEGLTEWVRKFVIQWVQETASENEGRDSFIPLTH